MDNPGAFKIPGKFCALPWIHRFTNVDGQVQVCCTSEEQDNTVRDEGGRRMVAPTDFDDREIMNSRFMKKLRLDLLKGKWPELCYRCEVTEAAGGVSRRENENIAYADLIPKLLEGTRADGEIPVEIRSMDMRLGNLCNLACRMCNPRSSSSWIRDWKKVRQDQFTASDDDLKQFKTFDWYKSPNVARQLQQQFPSLRHLHFAGGEPLIAPEMLDILKLAVDSGHSSHIDLTYNTNITKIPEEAKRLWPSFRAVRLYCSVDGFGAVNEYIRHPSRWKSIDRNLRDLEAHFDDWGIKEVLIMVTLQIYNIFNIPDLYDYLAENFRRVRQIPQTVELHNPSFMSIQVLPPRLKDLAEERLRELIARTEGRISRGLIPSWQSDVLRSLSGSIQFLRMADRPELVPAFLAASRSIDSFRSQDLFEVVPELIGIEDGTAPPCSHPTP